MYQGAKIIKIKPVENNFYISWRLDIRCNFDCSYCSDQWHSLTSTMKTLEELQDQWQKLLAATKDTNLKYAIGFAGGELTFNKNFLPFVKWLRTNYSDKIANIGLTTNGSASIDYYMELIDYVDYLSFSTHSEFFNERKFFNNVLACSKLGKSIHVNIMDEPWHQERIKKYVEFLTVNNINHTINKINFNYAVTAHPVKKSNLFDF